MASSLRCGRENLLYCLKAGPAGPATTRRSPGAGLTQRNRWSLQLQVDVGLPALTGHPTPKGRHVCSRHEPRGDVPALGPLGSAGQPDRPRDHELRVTVDESTSYAVMDAAIDAGINFFDTADVYGGPQSPDMAKGYGISEETIGRWLQ